MKDHINLQCSWFVFIGISCILLIVTFLIGKFLGYWRGWKDCQQDHDDLFDFDINKEGQRVWRKTQRRNN